MSISAQFKQSRRSMLARFLICTTCTRFRRTRTAATDRPCSFGSGTELRADKFITQHFKAMSEETLEQREPDARYMRAAVEVARLYGVVGVEGWDDLPKPWRRFIVDNVSYTSLVQPLVWRDKGKGLSWHQISNKYGISVQCVRTICRRAYLRARKSKGQ